MSWLKKYWPFLVLLFIVYGWYFITHTISHSSTDVLGANTNLALQTEPTDGRTQIVTALQSAQKEILVEVYLLSDKEIITALTDAKLRGVDVRVMLEQHPFGGANLNPATAKTLQTSGISVKWASDAFALTHEKTIVIDDKEAFILSQNLTTSAFTKNREYDIFDTNPEDVSEVRSIFIADWQRQPFSPKSGHLVVSPVNSRDGITALIQSATKEINIEVEDIADEQMVSLFCDKAKIVTIHILVPTLSQLSGNKKDLDELHTCGVSIETISSPYMHAKLILIDNTKAYIGSINLSTQSMDENREVGIILSQQDILQSLFTTFQRDWTKGKQLQN